MAEGLCWDRDPSQQWDLGKLPQHPSLWLPCRELQQCQVSQETGSFLTLQLQEAVLILPLELSYVSALPTDE